jgi:hypothetical protein
VDLLIEILAKGVADAVRFATPQAFAWTASPCRLFPHFMHNDFQKSSCQSLSGTSS